MFCCLTYISISFCVLQAVLKKHCGLFFINLSACLVNDDSPECRMMVANIITLMLEKLPTNENDNLFDIVLLWMKDNKVCNLYRYNL